MGQGQLKDIICKIDVELDYPRLHIQFQGHQSIGSGEEDF